MVKRGRCITCSAGFSLVEVLFALALFTTAITILTQAFVNTLLSLERTRQETDLNPVFRFVRSQVIQEPDRDTLERGGTIETLDYGSAAWEVTVEDTNVTDLFRVDLRIEITRPDTGEAEILENALFLLRPTWSESLDRSRLITEARDRLFEQRSAITIQ